MNHVNTLGKKPCCCKKVTVSIRCNKEAKQTAKDYLPWNPCNKSFTFKPKEAK